ncbi:phosphonate ABC transporter ATP-binding protein [Escherichia coli]|nr:phosphonate ABC transporter ATP-binding protein [Escherichia coli]
MQTIIRVEKLAKTFNQHQALHAVDLNIHHGEMVALLGPSGSGKSTLLRHLSGLIVGDKKPECRVELLGRTVQQNGRLARDIRKSRAHTGYIFQQFNLVNRLSVLENVLIGALGSTPFWRTCFSWFTREQKQRALQALTRVGMVHFAHQRVSTLSGGQQQRVAIARALMQQAKVILADEPIASLAFTSMFSLSTLFSPAHAEEQEKALNFGIISTESQQNLKPQWTPFLQDMEKKLGVKVNAFFAPDYAGIIQGMRFNKVDIAWYGNLSAMEAVDRANGQVFAQTVAADGSPGYWSVLIVNKDSPINNLSDLLAKRKDLTFGNGDPNSTSGFLVPGYYVFAKNNISANDFKRTVNAGHETNALAVANKQVDVATNNTENLDKLKTSAPEKLKELKVIWKSPLIPGDPIVWRKNLSETTKDKIYDFFMNYGKTPEEKAVLERLGWAPFRASSDLQLVPIRQLALFKEMQGVKSNKGLNEQDKLAKTTEIQAQLDDLDRLNNALSAMSSVSKAVQ